MSHYPNSLGVPCFDQGTTIVFKGYEDPNVHYVVEWCHVRIGTKAYLKVVAIGRDATCKRGFYYRYSDPRHPSFTLVVPTYLSIMALLVKNLAPSEISFPLFFRLRPT